MHLGFDGLFLEQPNTGSGQYARALLRQLAGRADVRITVLRPEPAPAVALAAAAGLSVVGLAAPTRLGQRRLRKVWWEQVGLPRAAARAGVDLIHVPYFAAPARPGRPLVVTVHDVIPLVLPLYGGSPAMRLYLRLVRRTVRRAAAVLTDSDAARTDILRTLGLPPALVTTVPLAAGEAMRPLPTGAVAPVLARLGVRAPYIVNAGGFDARKNLPFLIRAVARATRDRPEWRLVVVGQPHTGNARLYPDPRPVVAAEGLADRVVFTGFIGEEEKAALYSGAGLCVFATLYEGFGLPPLEAMACGAPVLAADRTSLPEVVGDGGALADPTDLDAFSAAIAALLADPDRRAALARAGLARAARFTWAATAEQTVAVYRRAVGGERGRGGEGERGSDTTLQCSPSPSPPLSLSGYPPVKIALLSKPLVHGAYQTKCEALAALPGVDLTVIVPPSWREIGAWETKLERRYTTGYRLVCTPIAFNGHHHVHFYPRLGRLLREAPPDIFHVDEEAFNFATFHAMWLGRRLGARLAFYTWANIHRRLPPPFSLFERACFAWSGRAFAGNRAAEAILRAKGYAKPIDVIPQFGVDPRLFEPAATRPDRPFTVGYLGRLTEYKGVHVLLRAVARLRGDWRLVIAGDGEFKPTLAALVADLGLGERVAFHPRVASSDAPALYRSFDALAVPSLTTPTWKEQFGRVIPEAMACRVVVVGSDSGEIPHVIGAAGLVTPEGDPAALAAALQRLLDDPAERNRLAEAGRQRALAHYTQASLARQYVEAYRLLLSTPGGDGA